MKSKCHSGRLLIAVVAFWIATALPGTSRAADIYWTGAQDSFWNTAGNWDINAVPAEGDTVYLNKTGAVITAPNPFNITASGGNSMEVYHSTGSLTILSDTEGNSEFFINSDGTGKAAYNLSGDGVLIKDKYEIKIGTSGTGFFNQSGGTFQMSSALYLGDQSGSTGTYNMTGGVLEGGSYGLGSVILGEWGAAGYFNQSGDSSVTLNGLSLARQVTGDGIRSYGRYVLSGNALLTTNATDVGASGDGYFLQEGGVHTTGFLTLGSNITEIDNGSFEVSSGRYDQNGGALYTSGATVGLAGKGVFNQAGGYHNTAGTLTIGMAAGSSGEYNLSGGDLYTTNTVVASEGTGVFNQTGGYHSSGSLTIGAGAASSGEYNLKGGDLSTAGTVVGDEGAGRFVQSGGTHTIAAYDTAGNPVGDLNLGSWSNGSGSYELSDGVLNVRMAERVGYSGTGYFIQTGGYHSVGADLVLANDTYSTGTIVLSGGILSVGYGTDAAGNTLYGSTFVGMGGKGTFTQTGGTHETAGGLSIGQEPNSTGIYYLNTGTSGEANDGQLLVGTDEHIGTFGYGIFTQGAGRHTIGGNLVVGNDTYAGGTFNLNGGSLSVAGNAYIGMNGEGEFNQTGGTNSIAGELILAEGSGSYGKYAISGGSLTTGFLQVGKASSGDFIQTGGTVITTSGLNIGQNSGSTGKYIISGGELSAIGGIAVGLSGDGYFTQESGTKVIAGAGLYLGYDTSATGVGYYYLNGGELQVTGYTTVGFYGQGTFIQSDGTHIVSNTLSVGRSAGSEGRYDLWEGILTTGRSGIGIEGTGSFNQYGGTHNVKGDLLIGVSTGSKGAYYLAAGSFNVGGSAYVGGSNLASYPAGGAGAFTQTGGTLTVAGSLVIAASPGSTGTYNMQGGTLNTPALENNGTFFLAAASSLNADTINNTGLFTAAGTINPYSTGTAVAFTNSGILAPGNSPGTLTILGNYSQTATGTLAIELGSTGHDVLNVTGEVSLAGILQVILYEGYTPAAGDSFIFLTASAITGRFTSIQGPGGYTWTVSYLDLIGGDEIADTLRLNVNSVPVPPALWLLGSGLAGIIGLRRRQRM